MVFLDPKTRESQMESFCDDMRAKKRATRANRKDHVPVPKGEDLDRAIVASNIFLTHPSFSLMYDCCINWDTTLRMYDL